MNPNDIASFRTATSLTEVVVSGLCIGCGLCEAVSCGKVRMRLTDYGSLRPTGLADLAPTEEAMVLSACPGRAVEVPSENGPLDDLVWGKYSSMRFAWAGQPDVRFRGSTGGVLTALGSHLLQTQRAQFVLHVGPDPEAPMRSRWVLSETPQEIEQNAGSRYGLVAPLAGLAQALDREVPFAIIAKPCDLSAVHKFAAIDPRLNRFCVARLALVCGGQSRLAKSSGLLAELGLKEDEVSVFRYRGYGNPGRTRVETVDGRAFERTYAELWEDEASWEIETRCKICPDALGEASDIAAADVWPDGTPSGEDAGFNGIIVRTSNGEALLESAVAAGELVLGQAISPREFDQFQPHQVRKKRALLARFSGLAEAGLPGVKTRGLRLRELARTGTEQEFQAEVAATVQRAVAGRFAEPAPDG